MVQFVHPQREDITLAGVLAALADPMRLRIVKSLLEEKDCMSCTAAAPCPGMAKSTLSNHFRILREAGLIQTSKKGVARGSAFCKPGILHYARSRRRWRWSDRP